jgi:hypothetical protein
MHGSSGDWARTCSIAGRGGHQAVAWRPVVSRHAAVDGPDAHGAPAQAALAA